MPRKKKKQPTVNVKDIIEKNRGLANRELAKFADQVTDLCNKWERK